MKQSFKPNSFLKLVTPNYIRILMVGSNSIKYIVIYEIESKYCFNRSVYHASKISTKLIMQAFDIKTGMSTAKQRLTNTF